MKITSLFIALLPSITPLASAQAKTLECYGFCELSHPAVMMGGVKLGPVNPNWYALFATGANQTEILGKLRQACAKFPHSEYVTSSKWIGTVIGPGSVNCNSGMDTFEDQKAKLLEQNEMEDTVNPAMVVHPRFAKIPTMTKTALVVVHPSAAFDTEKTAKAGIDQTIANFRAAGKPVIFLDSDLSHTGMAEWYTNERSPDYLAYSRGGENQLNFTVSEVTMVGGFLGNDFTATGCLTRAMHDVIAGYFERMKQTAPLTLHLPVSAIYYYDDDGVAVDLGKNPIDVPTLLKDIQATFFFNPGEDDNAGLSTNFGEVSNYGLPGPRMDTKRYRFEFYYDGKLGLQYGQGPRVVRLEFESPNGAAVSLRPRD